MPADYREKEQEFLGSLKADTGRDLEEWMRAIAAQNLPHRNDIIDWLRRQGFRFSRASWLERVYHNGGRAIYADQPAARSRPPRPRAPRIVVSPPPDERPPPAPRPAAPPALHLATPPTPASDLEPILAKAKAFRALALFLMREATRVLPEIRFVAAGDQIVFEGRRPFGLLSVSARELRLGLALPNRPFDQALRPARPAPPAGPGAPVITHVATLNDARQINETLLRHLKDAAGGDNST